MSLHQQFKYNKDVFVYKALNYAGPEYTFNLYTHPSSSRYSNSRNHYLDLPRPWIDIVKSSIAYAGPLLWNILPINIRSSPSLSSFKRNLRQHRKTCAYYYGS